MRVVAAIFNIVWFLFICLVLVTDGFPKEPLYIFFSLLHLVTPLLTLAVLFRYSMNTVMNTVAIACNVALLGFLCWFFLTQPPHPQEEGFVAFVVISVVTPILSVLAILRGGAGHARVLSGGAAV